MPKKIGRNQKCPCGSGKKYKRCCLRKGQPKKRLDAAPQGTSFAFDGGGVDELSNHALDLTNAGRFDEAEEACRQLRERYPDQIDQFDRLGELREAQGRLREAAEQYRHAAEFARTHPGFDSESIAFHAGRARALEGA